MFTAKLDDAALLRESIATISELIDETEVHIKNNGIHLIAADRAVVAVVDFFLSSTAFKEYNYQQDEKIGINLLSLLQIMRRAGPGDSVDIKLENNKLEIMIKGNSTRKFVLPLIDVSREETPPMDKLDFKTSLSIDSEILNSGIEDAELITDSIVFSVNNDQLTMKSESDSSSTQLDLQTSAGLKIIKIDSPVRARYSLDYLKKIFKARKLAQNANISMSTDYPMKAEFEIPEKMKLSFILAPRVEEG